MTPHEEPVPPSDSDVGGDTSNADDEGLFDVLDRYVDALHRLDEEGSGRLSTEHPGQGGFLRTLEALDHLAACATIASPTSDTDGPKERTNLGDGVHNLDGDWANGVEAPRSDTNTFGKFELLEELGRGGMGVVHRAVQKDLGRCVAIKMILASRLASPEDVRRFRAEARTAATVRHPHVVGIHEVGEHDGQSYFTMEYVAGPSLAKVVAEGPVDAERAAEIVAKLADAVEHLHEHGIVHRDIKPSNVLLDEEGEPYLTDFGLAKVFESTQAATRTGTILGTASYMAPEQAAGRTGEISSRTDVYGLGALLYELLTGSPPFREDHPLDTLVQVIEGEPVPARRVTPSVPRDLESICHRCLEKSPEARYASAADLAEDLRRFLHGDPIEAGAGTAWKQVRRWARRQPALVSRLAAIALAAGIIQFRYTLVGGTLGYHLQILGTLAAWGVCSAAFQWLLERPGWRTTARYCWLTTDVLIQTLVMFIADRPVGPLAVGYAVIIAASGLFFRVRLVMYTTCVCVGSYVVYAATMSDYGKWPHYGTIFCVLMAMQGCIVAYQVHRVRILSRYYDERLLP